MLEKVEIIKNDEKTTVDLISEFEITENGQVNRYALLTANEIDQNGLIKILATQISEGKMVRIQTEESWSAVKNVMRSIISASKGEFKYTNTSDNMSYEVSEDYARIIAVQDVAKQALVKDYEANKPKAEAPTKAESAQTDPNAGIYPTQNVAAPIGSEVVPGIAEVVENKEEVSIPVLEEAQNAPAQETSAPVQEAPSAAPESATQDMSEEQVVGTPAIETPVVETPAVETPVEEVQEEAAPQVVEMPTPEVAPAPEIETPVPENVVNATNQSVASSSTSPRDILVQDIIAAVDKYLASTNNSNDIKARLAKMQEELNLMNQSLEVQE